ncbi:DNA-binding response regulator [Candidatus Hydrogenosomobacter endosymbioticus]|uniref:DNA-binding response regulator n=2 Tax=Candidatus Hydrogenosomobacter endosymbioticus TaxID=2558174 RepID=A0ABM7V985_9PROT|nr:DNA-binding response regulator [Candidatus Hydrogenosomobacter endosymbioticus]
MDRLDAFIQNKNWHILIVDDDSRLRALLSRYLNGNGFFASCVESVASAYKAMAIFEIDCIVADIMMPNERGTELLSNSKIESIPPVIFLSAMSAGIDRINGLKLGAEDYITKPFEPQELVLRLNRILSHKNEKNSFSFGEFVYDFSNKTLKNGKGETVLLSSTEQQLLEVLLRNSNKSVSREKIAHDLQYEEYNVRTIDMQINRLRQKIEKCPKEPLIIRSIRKKGYCITTE